MVLSTDTPISVVDKLRNSLDQTLEKEENIQARKRVEIEERPYEINKGKVLSSTPIYTISPCKHAQEVSPVQKIILM